MKQSYLFLTLSMCTAVFPSGETFKAIASSVLTSVIDYDSRAYRELAREKEAKRRARFEATRLRLMEDDLQIALAGSQFTLSIARTLLHFISLLFDPQSLWAGLLNMGQKGLLGNLGFAFLVGWSGNKLYGYTKNWLPWFRPSQSTLTTGNANRTHALIENCQRSSKSYTKRHILTILRSLKAHAGVSHENIPFGCNSR